MTRASTTTPSRGRRRQVLQTLRDADGALSIAQIAETLGVHPNTARFHLDILVEAGQAQQVEVDHATPGRPPLMFSFIRRMDPDGPRRYQLLAEILVRSLADSPDGAAKAVEAGRAWTSAMNGPEPEHLGVDRDAGEDASIRRLLGLMDDLGFAPESSAVGIGLRHCPFVELAQQHSDVICPVHLGLMQGSLAAAPSTVTIERLEPFAEPDLCLVHLTTSERTG